MASSTASGATAKDASAAAAAKKDAPPDSAAQRAERLRRIQERVAVARPAPERPAPETFDDEAENRRGRDMIFDDDVVEERRYRSPDEAAEAE